jgi:ABC-type phosphate transport system auxiliary subunit
MNDLLTLLFSGGVFTFLGVVVTLIFTRKKSQAETDKAHAEIKKLEEEAEKIKIENENMRTGQMHALMKQNLELEKAREELKAKLYIANEEKLMLSQELQRYRIELTENQRKLEEILATQHKDIVEMKKQTGQLPAQLPNAMEHEK